MSLKPAGRALAALTAAILAVGLAQVTVPAAASAAISAPAIRGLNWADGRDNFVCGNLLPTGLWDGESYETVYSKSSAIVDGFIRSTAANTIRLPVNVDTVAGSWWNSYIAAIDAATAKGLNVILSEWDMCNSRDGRLDPGWEGLWDKVVAKYGSNDAVLFEIMNEPFGYSASEWLDTAASWLGRYSSVPRGRIIVSGPGYNNNAYAAGRDQRFNGTLLSVHHYAFWQDAQSYQAWRNQTTAMVAEFAGRAVFTEFGTFMTTGLNFNDGNSSTNEVQYLRGLTDQFNALGVGSVYWPGLRSGDNYSLLSISGDTQNGSGSTISLRLNNQSGLDRLRIGWRM
jgi:cellulase (glycosyl hydrolase family 5)